MLFGVGRVFAFVMDTTGSMSGIQRSVAKQAEAIARNLTKDDGGVGFFVISPFNDPSTGPVTTVTSIESLQTQAFSMP
jgi:von Willebrand factor A domain-containing protein 7